MMKYLQKVKDITSVFKYFEISYIRKMENAWIDVLSQLATTSSNLLDRIFIKQSSIDKVDEY